jgi:hypothetical protein
MLLEKYFILGNLDQVCFFRDLTDGFPTLPDLIFSAGSICNVSEGSSATIVSSGIFSIGSSIG